MKKSVRTIYGATIDTAKRFDEDLPILPNSTLNQKFDVFKDELPRSKEYPHTQFLAIGLRGSVINMDTDGLYTTSYREYSPSWASLLTHAPFIVRPITEPLTAAERANYRMRVIKEYNGVFYECWMLRKLDFSQGGVVVEKRKLIDGNIVPEAWTPSLNDLNPVPIVANPNQVIRTGDDYLAATRRFPLNFTPVEIQELLNAVNIIHGTPDKANFTEFALVAGIDRNLQGNFNGVNQSYTESAYSQITDFVKSTISAPNSLLGAHLQVDAGSAEPLLIVAG